MAAGFLGCVVSIECGDMLGSYQGQVSEVNGAEQTITIIKAFHNGIKCQFPKIIINASDIRDISILKSPSDSSLKNVNPVVSSSTKLTSTQENGKPLLAAVKSGLKKEEKKGKTAVANGKAVAVPRSKSAASPRHLRTSPMTNGYASRNGYHNNTPSKNDEEPRHRTYSASENDMKRKTSTPKKLENYQRGRKMREDCFSSLHNDFMDEFDFEKNLALFDKQAVFEEIEKEREEMGYPKIVRPTNQPAKYRCDENIIQADPVVYRQIKMPQTPCTEYKTDSGLVVPSITLDMRNRILEAAEEQGLSKERQMEMVGRSASEMVMQLLGGSTRLNPKNVHQCPRVVVLCGPHIQGAYGVNCARHLAMHDINVTVFTPNFVKVIQELQTELHLFQLSDGTKASNVKELPTHPIDMIVNCLENHDNAYVRDQQWFKQAVAWANGNKAPVLAVDPPVQGGPMDTKWSLSVLLPLPLGERCGQLYLSDLAVPKSILRTMGITYRSPFGHKFFIALHADA